MKNINKPIYFDDDFLWLFNKFGKVAVCFSPDLNIIALTPAASSFFMVSNEKILGKPLSSLFSPFGLEVVLPENGGNPVLKVINRVIAKNHKSQKAQNLNWEIKSKTAPGEKGVGFIVYAEERTDIGYLAQVYKMVTGQDEIVQGSIEDYAENIKSYLENIIACMPGNIYWMDKNCVYLGCNDNAAKFCGLSSRKEVVGSTYEDIEKKAGWVVGHTEAWKNDDMEVIATGKPKLNVEERPVLMPDGKEVVYLTSRVPLFDKEKNVIGVLGVSIDITDRKIMGRELQQAHERAEKAEKGLLVKLNQEITGHIFSEEKSPAAYVKNVQNYLESIIDRLPGNIFWMDKNCVYLGCNDNVVKFLGLNSRKDIVGMTYESMEKQAGWTSGHTALWKRDDLEVIATGNPKLNVEENPVLMPNGEKIFYLTSRVPLFDDKGCVIGVAAVSIDISDRKKAERLQKEKDVAEKTSGFMRMLAGSIAHEIRTPLAIIGINADLLNLKIEPLIVDDKTKSSVDSCFNNIKYAIDLSSYIVRDILTMLKTISSDELLEKKFKPLSIEGDIKQVLNIYPFLDYERDLVKLDFDKSQDFIYYGDNMLTQHLLFNLIKNALYAIKEAEKGGIVITLEKGKKHNLLKFKDTALGIPKDVLSRVFDYFRTGKVGGAGLGLAFCRVVMNAYGGDISCNSKEGKYTEFVLKFPQVLPSQLVND